MFQLIQGKFDCSQNIVLQLCYADSNSNSKYSIAAIILLIKYIVNILNKIFWFILIVATCFIKACNKYKDSYKLKDIAI